MDKKSKFLWQLFIMYSGKAFLWWVIWPNGEKVAIHVDMKGRCIWEEDAKAMKKKHVSRNNKVNSMVKEQWAGMGVREGGSLVGVEGEVR